MQPKETVSWWGNRNRENAGGKVSVITDYYTSSILVVGNEEQQEDVQAIIDSLGSSLGNAKTFIEVIRIEHADAQEAASAVENFLRDRRRSRGGEERVVVTSVASSDAILVSGSARRHCGWSRIWCRRLIARILAENARSRSFTSIAVMLKRSLN